MGFFGALFGAKTKTSELDDAALIASMAPLVLGSEYEVLTYTASLLERVITEAGIAVLMRGTLTLNDRFVVDFEIYPKANKANKAECIAKVSVDSLADAAMLKVFARSDRRNVELLGPAIDALAYDVIREFNRQCPAFEALPKNFQIMGL